MDDDRFETRIRDTLDEGLEGITPDVARRLRRARHEAIARADRRLHRWAPAAALVFASLVLAAIILRPAENPVDLPVTATDLEIIAADDSLQFYEELDFYQWLAAETGRDAG